MRARETTVTMGLPKIGLLKPAAAEFVGRIETADIGFPRKLVDEIPDRRGTGDRARRGARCCRRADGRRTREISATCSSLRVRKGYTGAPVMAAQAAARAGAGLVTLAVPRSIYRIVAANCPPEVMPRPADFDKLDHDGFCRVQCRGDWAGVGSAGARRRR